LKLALVFLILTRKKKVRILVLDIYSSPQKLRYIKSIIQAD